MTERNEQIPFEENDSDLMDTQRLLLGAQALEGKGYDLDAILAEYGSCTAWRWTVCRKLYRLNTEEKVKGNSNLASARHQRTGNVLLGSLSSQRMRTAMMTSISTPPQKLL